jgi:hypothetical protein
VDSLFFSVIFYIIKFNRCLASVVSLEHNIYITFFNNFVIASTSVLTCVEDVYLFVSLLLSSVCFMLYIYLLCVPEYWFLGTSQSCSDDYHDDD